MPMSEMVCAACRHQIDAAAKLCPYCGAGHLGRARTEAQVPGVRRSRCGHQVVVTVARTYRGAAA